MSPFSIWCRPKFSFLETRPSSTPLFDCRVFSELCAQMVSCSSGCLFPPISMSERGLPSFLAEGVMIVFLLFRESLFFILGSSGPENSLTVTHDFLPHLFKRPLSFCAQVLLYLYPSVHRDRFPAAVPLFCALVYFRLSPPIRRLHAFLPSHPGCSL